MSALDFYTWDTPNGQKVGILLKELNVPYNLKPINISKGEQMQPSFLAVNPNNKIPAIRDGDLSVFESAAILQYLSEKHGGQFVPKETAERWACTEWLFWQMGGLGPMLGQLGFFAVYSKEKIPLAIERYKNESLRLLGVLNKRLAETGAYLAGSEYSIADISSWPWINAAVNRGEAMGINVHEQFPEVKRWHLDILARPAVQAALSEHKEKCVS